MMRVPYPEDNHLPAIRYASPFTIKPFSPNESDTNTTTNNVYSGTGRKRLLSLPLAIQEDILTEKIRRSLHIGRYSSDRNDETILDDSQELQSDDLNVSQDIGGEEKEKRKGGIRAFIRRASSVVRPRRYSHSLTSIASEPQDPRPPTSKRWHRLRQAASFRHSRADPESGGSAESCETLVAPIPGFGNAPPVIPRNSGGAAARATAALQNEHLERTRHFLDIEDSQDDHESGVGIAVTVPSHSQYQDESINRVDFITALPLELAIQVLSHLDHRGLIQAALVSRDWSRISSTSDVWREAFCREKSSTYAMSGPTIPGSGCGLPTVRPDKPWKDIYRVRHELEANWRGGKARPVYLNGHLDSIYCVQFDEYKIITGSRDKTIRIWDMHTYECRLIIGPPEVVKKQSIMIGADQRPLHYAAMPDATCTAECIPPAVAFPIHHNASILCLQYDEEILVTGSSDGTCIVYNIKNGYRPVRRLQHHSAAVLDLAFDDNHIVTCSKDVTICVWDRRTGAMLKQLRGHSGPVNAVQMRGNTIVSCSGDFKVKLWNIDTGKNIREFIGHSKGLACSQFSDDSRLIASAGNDKFIRIWDANTGECLRRIEAHENLVRSLHIDSVSGRLVSGSYDQDIKVFDMESGRMLLDFPKWHSSWVLGAKSDYRRIISTGQDPKILIMDFGIDIDGIELLESDDGL